MFFCGFGSASGSSGRDGRSLAGEFRLTYGDVCLALQVLIHLQTRAIAMPAAGAACPPPGRRRALRSTVPAGFRLPCVFCHQATCILLLCFGGPWCSPHRVVQRKIAVFVHMMICRLLSLNRFAHATVCLRPLTHAFLVR